VLSGGKDAGRKGIEVTLIATLLDEEESLGGWWASISGQTRPPDEVVIVDGGSRDGTVPLLRTLAERASFPVRVEVLEGSNIARGRNRAIELASHGVIAVTDGGCTLSPTWLERLLRPMEDDPALPLVAGFYQPMCEGFFEELSACATLPLPWEVREGRFLPSSRSLAFRREVWERVGGYPEWLEIGEDMYFNHAWRGLGIDCALAKDALVYWRMRKDLPSLLRQYFLYARGDGESGMYPQRHALRFATYGWIVFCAAKGGERLWGPTLAAAATYAARRWARIPVYMSGRPAANKLAALPGVPALMMAIDGAKMAGYVDGLLKRSSR
jgi:glycosyltransferase involved in cell wall biosynthesis